MTAIVSPPASSTSRRWVRWLATGMRQTVADLRRHWVITGAVALIWSLAMVRVFVYSMPLVPVLFNVTGSLPYHVAVVDYTASNWHRGDLVVFEFDGEAGFRDYPGLRRQPFFKRVAGVAGDEVRVDGRNVFVNGTFVGIAKPRTFDRRPLEPIAPGVIPPGQLYVQGSSPDSFDSRYRSSGLVAVSQVKARVIPLL